jgi:hypothetical protein
MLLCWKQSFLCSLKSLQIYVLLVLSKKFDGFWFFFSYTELKQIQSGADSEHISIVHDTNPFFFYKSSLSDNNLSIYLFSHKKSPTLKNPKELILWFVTIIVRLDTLTKSSSRRHWCQNKKGNFLSCFSSWKSVQYTKLDSR